MKQSIREINVWVILSESITYIIYYSCYVPTFLKLSCSLLCFLRLSFIHSNTCFDWINRPPLNDSSWLIKHQSSTIDHWSSFYFVWWLKFFLLFFLFIIPSFPPPSFWWMILVVVFLFVSIQDVIYFVSLSLFSSSSSHSCSSSSSSFFNWSFIVIFLIIITIIQYNDNSIIFFVLFNFEFMSKKCCILSLLLFHEIVHTVRYNNALLHELSYNIIYYYVLQEIVSAVTSALKLIEIKVFTLMICWFFIEVFYLYLTIH